jgi:hypothetical protein
MNTINRVGGFPNPFDANRLESRLLDLPGDPGPRLRQDVSVGVQRHGDFALEFVNRGNMLAAIREYCRRSGQPELDSDEEVVRAANC